jgi:hypothetical protein
LAVRATGLQGEALPAVIEIIEDDGDSFGDRGPATSAHDSGGPRWIGPTAAAVLIALVGYGVATSATKGLPKVAAPPTTVAPATPSTTPPPTTSTEPPPVVPYYAADPPREFAVQSAKFLIPDTRRLRENGFQLWATDGAGASNGSWFSLESYRTSPHSLLSIDAYRAVGGDRPIAISHLATGHSLAQFELDDSLHVNLTAFGWSDDDLVRLAQSLSVDGNDLEVGDRSLIAGYEMLTAVPPWLAIEGRPAEQIQYTTSSDAGGNFIVLVAEHPPIPGGVKSRERQTALRFMVDQATPFDVDGHSGIAGLMVGADDQAIATWAAGDHLVSLSAQMPVADLVAIAQTVHQVTVDEWRGMQFQAAIRLGGNDTDGQSDATSQVTVSQGTDTESNPWAISVGIATFGSQRQINWQVGNYLVGRLARTDPTIDSAVDSRRTYVLAQLPRTAAATAQLQINRTGLDPVVVAFTEADPTFDRTFAAYAFSDAGPYTAQIVGADGAVLASWPK